MTLARMIASGLDRLLAEHEDVERIAVVAVGARHEAVVRRVVNGREQDPVDDAGGPDVLSSSYFTFEPVGISMIAGIGLLDVAGQLDVVPGMIGHGRVPSDRRAAGASAQMPAAVREALLADLGLRDAAPRRHAVGEPDVAADRRALPDGDAAEDGGAGVDHDVVLDDRVRGRSP